MENSLKALILAASISITCMVISIGFYAARQSGFIASKTTEKLNNIAISFEEEEYAKYDGLVIKGGDLVSFIYKNLGSHSSSESPPVYIYVDTGLSTKRYVDKKSINETKDYSSNYYIHPLAKFKGELIRNDNNVIVGLSFIAT